MPFFMLSNQFYTAKELPQPQVAEALGLLKMNPLASRPFFQSISIPNKYMEWAGSMMQGIPPTSNSSSRSERSSISNK